MSVEDTKEHIDLVRNAIDTIQSELRRRAVNHDKSKLEEPELSGYEGLSEAVKGLQYGSMAYRMAFAPYKEIIQHHYASNDHHIEWAGGDISRMNLMQIVEMVCDWKAASMRSSPTLGDSLEISFKRYGIESPLSDIIRNTVISLEW